MFWQMYAAFVCPLMAGLAGYQLNGKASGAFAGFTAYAALILYSSLMRQHARRDYWASKLAMFKAEEAALNLALAKEYREQTAGPLLENNRAVVEAYRGRLALLQVSMTALRAGYASEKEAGILGHVSERWSGLVLARPG
jgi:hypothetical protein